MNLRTWTDRVLGRRAASADKTWDLPTVVGRTTLRNPVMPASGTYGFGLEYLAYGDPSLLGALVIKSLSAKPWGGNAAPRLHPLAPGSMVNNIGLPNPGVEAWATATLPLLLSRRLTIVASIWGHTPEELLDAARLMSGVSGPAVWEINLSCPNLSTSSDLPSHNPEVAYEVCAKIRGLADASVGLWAKLSPHAPDIRAVARACSEAAVDAVTMTNTVPVKALSEAPPVPPFGSPGGGVSGAVLKPIVMGLVAEVREECPSLPIVAAGGVLTVHDALDHLDNGARAVQVGTANFIDPTATHQIAAGVVAARLGQQSQTEPSGPYSSGTSESSS